MSIEGLWTARFGHYDAPNTWENGGVVVIESGRIFGGDSGTYYLGSVVLDGKSFDANFTVTIYDRERYITAFGNFETPIEVSAKGERKGNVIVGRMSLGEVSIAFDLTKRADLP